MDNHSRQELLIRSLQERSPRTVAELEVCLGASPATIRRDLTFLEKAGKIVRTHGSVYHVNHFQGEASFDRKSKRAIEAKAALADAAVGLVECGAHVFVDAGTAALEVGRRLLRAGANRELTNLTIYTNSIPMLSEQISENRGVSMIALGGEVRPLSMALTGSVALEWMGRLRFDIAFLGTSGVDPGHGVTTTEISEAALKTAVLGRAARIVVLADAAKWASPAAIRYADWRQIHDFFTDYSLSPHELELLEKHGVRLHPAQNAQTVSVLPLLSPPNPPPTGSEVPDVPTPT